MHFKLPHVTLSSQLLKSTCMESVASNSNSSSSSSFYNHCPRFKPSQPVAERIIRALRHRLLLLHRLDSAFFILGATGNVYTVTLSTKPSCTCPDRTAPCKHILFVFIRVLGASLDDVCIRRSTLRPCQLNRLLRMPTLPDSVAGISLRERFHQLFFRMGQDNLRPVAEVEDGTTCPVCLEVMGKQERVLACRTCRNPIHEECLVRWKRSRGRRLLNCVICRARWREFRSDQQDKYLNLAAYVSEEDVGDVNGGSSCAV